MVGKVRTIGSTGGGVDVIGPCDIEGQRIIGFPEDLEPAGEAEIQTATARKQRNDLVLFLSFGAFAVAIDFQLGNSCKMIQPGNRICTERICAAMRSVMSICSTILMILQ